MPSLTKVPRRRGLNLVVATAEVLREHIFALEPGALIGSLHDLAYRLEVGIVTLQQAARVLEHEGLLEVRRGPGGGYYGARPDDAALERAFDAYLRVHPATYEEALDMTSLLFNELVAAAAGCREADMLGQLGKLGERLDDLERTAAALGSFELEFQDQLFRMVSRPLFEMLTRVTLHYAWGRGGPQVHQLQTDSARWCEGRRKIIDAILAGDAELARFEANRQNRQVVRRHLGTRRP
ncbi:FadR/GntR family transcriptional regulator [Novosphingobium beihaiensis]|uniref:FCD domain-containing protein n=1 Tax=Novosphingobium beihaiensis TaxID=2930389 RepID=A0ABT0BLX9_9SPHN|nr:FCD domain-containing protein [Novosphingobium beihaiensis]MCJ2185714.1 FCD domain-containing protein [Novosphingobium beihaiensis]